MARRRARRSPKLDLEAARLAWVREHAPGRSFVDVGGLFKYMGDIAFLAEEVGATSVTLLDVGDPDLPAASHREWGSFAEKSAARGSAVRYVQGDLEDPLTPERVGAHDIVFYSGVLYHTPNPLLQLMQLRAMTRELAYISTLTIPEIPGFSNACIFYPHLTEAELRGYAAGYHWSGDLLGIGAPFDERPMFGYANCWWGITGTALRSMLTTARFEVVDEHVAAEGPFLTSIVVRPLPLDPLLPPVSYFRQRAEARERGEPPLSFDTWYDDQRAATVEG
jgi:hypothetical protein